jgi:hypothetical protein
MADHLRSRENIINMLDAKLAALGDETAYNSILQRQQGQNIQQAIQGIDTNLSFPEKRQQLGSALLQSGMKPGEVGAVLGTMMPEEKPIEMTVGAGGGMKQSGIYQGGKFTAMGEPMPIFNPNSGGGGGGRSGGSTFLEKENVKMWGSIYKKAVADYTRLKSKVGTEDYITKTDPVFGTSETVKKKIEQTDLTELEETINEARSVLQDAGIQFPAQRQTAIDPDAVPGGGSAQQAGVTTQEMQKVDEFVEPTDAASAKKMGWTFTGGTSGGKPAYEKVVNGKKYYWTDESWGGVQSIAP